ncbi:GyrI-like domain-containing protein [Clostridium ganghwense]|uniref:GyrI-like domain-containing protein n=1 Tax=Clostridium ganghwense TaxID=312089 RepID=A0ABT4CRI8_9CLOT|nr:GyrI-like domain-containing protein [Clostridium ganghwense]MCY6371693.1 GyrI-like domain-containing protein [Clostridium ganghwense]
MKYEIVELKEKQVVGIIKKTTNENMQAVKDIGELWQRFIAEEVYNNIENKVNQQGIGLYTNYEGDYTKPYSFMTCCEVSAVGDLKHPLIFKTINAGKYAKFSIRGHIQEAVMDVWEAIWALNLNRKYECDFEIYHNNSEDMTDQIIDIYISII